MPKVISLTPPRIEPKVVLEKLWGTRPVREGKFNISLEQKWGKTLVHCYGHGGSGWTTLFGSVNQAISLYEESRPSKKEPICVVGSGCIGLTLAITLEKLGYRVTTLYAKELYDIPSWRAAGYFGVVSVKTAKEEQQNLDRMGFETFCTYQAIERGEHPYIPAECVKLMPVYCGNDVDSGLEDLERRGLIPKREAVTLDFGRVVHPHFVKYMTYFLDTAKIMQTLLKQVGVPITVQTLSSFEEPKEKVVFNCTGLGSRELNSDTNMCGVRGHLIALNELAGTAHMEYMLYTKVMQDRHVESLYLFPQHLAVTQGHERGIECHGVIGGTFIPDVDKLSSEAQEELNRKEFAKLLERHAQFFHGHPFTT